MKIISVREYPEYKDKAIEYFNSKWSSVPRILYEDSISHALSSRNPLPQWYLLEKDGKIIGSSGLITNDFISRMDLYPWVCALYVEEAYRGNAYSSLLLEKAKDDAVEAGFDYLYLSTEHIGLYEKYGFRYIGQGYHPWGEDSRIYEISLAYKREELNLKIRPERMDEFAAIHELIRTAFKTANVKEGDEQDFADGLRKSSGYIPELALVAESNHRLIGHSMLTKAFVIRPDGTHFDALLLAPVSVLLEYRNRGVGISLINEGCRLAGELGYKAIFLVGDPGYYSRFGFKATSIYGITSKAGIPAQYVRVKELVPDALNGVHGVIDCC